MPSLALGPDQMPIIMILYIAIRYIRYVNKDWYTRHQTSKCWDLYAIKAIGMPSLAVGPDQEGIANDITCLCLFCFVLFSKSSISGVIDFNGCTCLSAIRM